MLYEGIITRPVMNSSHRTPRKETLAQRLVRGKRDLPSQLYLDAYHNHIKITLSPFFCRFALHHATLQWQTSSAMRL